MTKVSLLWLTTAQQVRSITSSKMRQKVCRSIALLVWSNPSYRTRHQDPGRSLCSGALCQTQEASQDHFTCQGWSSCGRLHYSTRALSWEGRYHHWWRKLSLPRFYSPHPWTRGQGFLVCWRRSFRRWRGRTIRSLPHAGRKRCRLATH